MKLFEGINPLPEEALSLNAEDILQRVRKVMLYGDVTEESAKDLVCQLLAIKEVDFDLEFEETKASSKKIDVAFVPRLAYKPIEIYVSTNGGIIDEMMSIYDTIRIVKEFCDVPTVGVGKIKSAGVLILAAGTKGSRRIFRNCRVMIHNPWSEQRGTVVQVSAETEELQRMTELYKQLLIEETEMTEELLDDILKRNIDYYLTAEQAVELGIADEVI